MKIQPWTLGLAAAGVVSLASAVQAEETKNIVTSALSATTISGSVNTSAIWKFGTGNFSMPGRMFDVGSGFGAAPGVINYGRQDGFNLDSVTFKLSKDLGEGQWASGYTAEFIYGPDANLYGTPSLTGARSPITVSDFAIKQAYVTLRAPVGNGIDFKVGVWDTIVGYEVYDYATNPNFSRSYAYFLEPFTHTGILATYKAADFLTVSGGIANSSGVFGVNQINGRGSLESGKSFLASVALTAPESMGFLKGSTLYAGFTDIQQDSGTAVISGVTKDRLNIYVGGSLATPIKGLAVGLAYDYIANSVYNGDWANTFALYSTFQVSEKLKIAGRGEYVKARNGVLFANPGTQENEYLGVTVTADYALWANVVTRAELRWDTDLNGGQTFGGINGPSDKNAVSLALNVIYRF